MLNPRCPNCSFALVLLERRGKYKCSKCSRLFLQKEIDDKTFRQWNVKQRELDEHNLNLEKKQRKERPKITEEERKLKAKEWRLKNIQRCKDNSAIYYEKNKERILA